MKKSVKIFITFLISITTLSAFFYYWHSLKGTSIALPFGISGSDNPTDGGNNSGINFLTFTKEISGGSGKKNYLVLFQNSMELRPTGGFVGSFAQIEVEDEKIISKTIYDTAVFDSSLEGKTPYAPFLIKKYLYAENWGMRDVNWNFDFPTSAQRAADFYKLSSPEAKIDGVIGITTDLLVFLIQKTGPITLEGIEGEFNEKNIVEKLEYEVEVGYAKKGIKKESRKNIMNDLFNKLFSEISNLNKLQQLALLKEVKELMDQKKIQLFFYDEKLEKFAQGNNWGGEVKQIDSSDYLAIIDSNLGALKSDRCLERTFNYYLDFSDPKNPLAKLDINYLHTCGQKDFMTEDYHSYVRVYAPINSSLVKTIGFDKGNIDELMKNRDDAVVETENNKKVFGNLVFVRLKEQRTYSFLYNLPANLTSENYQLFFQKQAGMKPPHLKVTFKKGEQEEIIFEGNVEKDTMIKK